MFAQIKPGHVLRFGTDPGTIISPPGHNTAKNDNTLATPWPMTSALGTVQCISHPSGTIGEIAAEVASKLRGKTAGNDRAVSYSTVGRALSSSDRIIGSQTADFVGYVDGQSNFIKSGNTVFSKDFSGCLMVVYYLNGVRHVAHASASAVATMDCKQAFLNTLRAKNARLGGWFKPYVQARDVDGKLDAFKVASPYVRGSIDALTTFGVITQSGQAYSLEAFRPTKEGKALPDGKKPVSLIGKGQWIVTSIKLRTMSPIWTVM